ncbi:SIMPL domain-containing protein [Neptunicella sp. SCSIO 80796]|uniref:SIMPL domain-containing protein n=1 Tax=Neptunicella plasticusilytica TaxID=3117012 RepID=UPI003A4D3FFC
MKLSYLLLLAGLFTSPLYAQDNQIRVSGKGAVAVKPDQLQFTVLLEEKGAVTSKLNASLEQNSQLIVNLLNKHGVENKDIQSLRVQLSPWFERDQDVMKQSGFVLSRQIRINLRQLDQYDKIIDGILKIGANRIEGFQYIASNERDMYDEALSLAVQDAAERAQVLTKAADIKLGNVLSINENASYGAPHPMMKMNAMAESSGYQPGQIQVTADVEVVFSIQAQAPSQ